jgi:hypothetical protein
LSRRCLLRDENHVAVDVHKPQCLHIAHQADA